MISVIMLLQILRSDIELIIRTYSYYNLDTMTEISKLKKSNDLLISLFFKILPTYLTEAYLENKHDIMHRVNFLFYTKYLVFS